MRRPRVVPFILLTALVPAGARASSLDAGVLAAEIDRLGTLVADPDLGESGERLRSIHQEAAESMRRGRPHWALQRLQLGLVLTAAYRYMVDQREQVTDLGAFERLWREQERIPEQARLAGRTPSCRQAPSQVRALVETAANRAGRHYHAARAMARATAPPSGLFYLGRARAEARLVRLCEVFRGADPGAAEPGREGTVPAVRAELSALEDATDLAYAMPGAAIDRHDDFIGLNAALKELGELDDAGLSFGALDRFLDATLRLSRLEATSSAPTADELRRRIDGVAATLAADGRDHSIALAYLERAASVLDDPEAKDGDRITARHIVDRVLPAYLVRVDLTSP